MKPLRGIDPNEACPKCLEKLKDINRYKLKYGTVKVPIRTEKTLIPAGERLFHKQCYWELWADDMVE